MILNTISPIQEKFLFLYRFLCSPAQIGSVTPSSKFLARKMIESVPWSEVANVAELGAGTGAITQHIQKAARADTKVLLFETDQHMLANLRHRFPQFSCYTDCCNLLLALQEEQIDELDSIISGLPFFNFPKDMRNALLNQVLKSLKDKGLFITFQYSCQMKGQLSRYFDIEKIVFVPLNVPPAFVYVCRKKREMALNDTTLRN